VASEKGCGDGKVLRLGFRDFAVSRIRGVGSAAEPDSSIAATKAAEAKGEAKQTAKFWGLAAGLPVPIGGTIWKAFRGLK
jgi:hypothetical protein